MVKISVVMGVYNGADLLDETLASIFAQTERDFELIVVDDGSTDATPAILASCRDPRLPVIRQENAGLTRALIRGCAETQSLLIARHDCGDISMADRFEKQVAAFADDDVVLVSCETRYRTPRGEALYVSGGNGESIRRRLLEGDSRSIGGIPHHGSTMFRRDAYERAGGYRPEFYFAQDLDLWVRIAPLGRIVVVPEVLYQATFQVDAISSTNRPAQLAITKLIVKLRDERAAQPRLLDRAREVQPRARGNRRRCRAQAFHFIASCLKRQGNEAWRDYAREALRLNRFRPGTWLLFLRRF